MKVVELLKIVRRGTYTMKFSLCYNTDISPADGEADSFGGHDSTVVPGTWPRDIDAEGTQPRGRLDLVASSLTNPLSTAQPAFMATDDGRTCE